MEISNSRIFNNDSKWMLTYILTAFSGLWNVPYITGVYLIHGSLMEGLRDIYSAENVEPDMAFCGGLRKRVCVTSLNYLMFLCLCCTMFSIGQRYSWKKKKKRPLFRWTLDISNIAFFARKKNDNCHWHSFRIDNPYRFWGHRVQCQVPNYLDIER